MIVNAKRRETFDKLDVDLSQPKPKTNKLSGQSRESNYKIQNSQKPLKSDNPDSSSSESIRSRSISPQKVTIVNNGVINVMQEKQRQNKKNLPRSLTKEEIGQRLELQHERTKKKAKIQQSQQKSLDLQRTDEAQNKRFDSLLESPSKGEEDFSPLSEERTPWFPSRLKAKADSILKTQHFHQMMNLIEPAQQKIILDSKKLLIRKVQIYFLVTNLIYQIAGLNDLFQQEHQGKHVFQAINWLIWSMATLILAHSFYKDDLKNIFLVQCLILLRNALPMIDMSDRRLELEQGPLLIFVLLQLNGISYLQIGLSFISTSNFQLLLIHPFISVMSLLGTYKMIYKDEKSLEEILIENKRIGEYLVTLILCLFGIFLIHYMTSHGSIEIIKFWRERNSMIKEVENIFYSLKESIITLDQEGINFTNPDGKKILNDIHETVKEQKQPKQQNARNQQDNKQDNTQGSLEKKDAQTPNENQLLRAKVFRLYKNNITEKLESQQERTETQTNLKGVQSSYLHENYSLREMCKIETKQLDQMIFMLDHVCEDDEFVVDNLIKKSSEINKDELDASKISLEKKKRRVFTRYVQIKTQIIVTDNKRIQMMQIIDISKDIMYSITNGEKKLLALINATVSHEMRNPLNCITSQNIRQILINEKIVEFIRNELSRVCSKKICKKLQKLQQEQQQSITIQMSSSKILCFLVNDILDFSQLRSGKFRKDIANFNIKEAVEEIVQIQREKAEFCGINLSFTLENFPVSEDQIDERDLIICTDQRRLQQILLNLQSNALKFTPTGGSITIVCKFIKCQSDIEEEQLKPLFTQDTHKEGGMVQISVTDTGIGIKHKDQSQLFKLFGFLDTSKEMNTKGVGLGLHISKMIAQQLGGNCCVRSEFGKGSTFTFILALSLKRTNTFTVKRIQNPIMKKYQKIIIKKQDFVDKKKILVEQEQLNHEIGSFFKKISDESSDDSSSEDPFIQQQQQPVRVKSTAKFNQEIVSSQSQSQDSFVPNRKKPTWDMVEINKSSLMSMSYPVKENQAFAQPKVQQQILSQSSSQSSFVVRKKAPWDMKINKSSVISGSQLSNRLSLKAKSIRKLNQEKMQGTLNNYKQISSSNANLKAMNSFQRHVMESSLVSLNEDPQVIQESSSVSLNEDSQVIQESTDEHNVTDDEESLNKAPNITILRGQQELSEASPEQSQQSKNLIKKDISDRKKAILADFKRQVSDTTIVIPEEHKAMHPSRAQFGLSLESDLNDKSINSKEIFMVPKSKKTYNVQHLLVQSSSSGSDSEDLIMNGFSQQSKKKKQVIFGKSLTKAPSRKIQSSSQLPTDFGINKRKIKNKRILIVDDEPYNLMGLKIIIDACDEGKLINLIIDQATNGMEAFKAVKLATEKKQYEYGLIFMDCSMPILDGYEASDRIRQYLRNHYEPQPMIVACTGHTEIEYIKKAWRHQMDEVVPKPANIQVVKCIIDDMIEYRDD